MADIIANGAVTVPVPTIAGVGTTYSETVANGEVTAPIPTVAGVANIGISADGALTAPTPYVLANATIGISAAGALTAPIPTVAGIAGNTTAEGEVTAPIPTVEGVGLVEIVATGALTAPLPIVNCGVRYNITIKCKPLFAGPERDSFAEIFMLVAFCEFYDINPFDITLTSDYRRYTSPADYVADEEVRSNQAAAGQPYFRHNVGIIPKAGFVGTFFQYELVKACPTDGEFKFFGVDMPFIPKPNLTHEFLLGMGDITDGW